MIYTIYDILHIFFHYRIFCYYCSFIYFLKTIELNYYVFILIVLHLLNRHEKAFIEFFTKRNKEGSYKNIETLASRLERVIIKKSNKNRTQRMRRDFRRTKDKNFELKLFELNRKLAILKDSENEIHDRLDVENQKLSNIQRKTRYNRKYGEISSFDFNDINQHDDEINLNEILDLAENNKTKYDRKSVFDVIVGSQRDKYPYILNGEFIVYDGEPFQVNRFYKDSEQITKSIEKMIDKYHETLEVLFLGFMMKYTMIFKQLKGSNNGEGYDEFNNILENKGNVCCIPTGNACFRKCSEFIYKKDFSNEYKKFILDSDRCKNVLTSAKIQQFCGEYNNK